MIVTATCTYRQTRQGTVLDANSQMQLGTVVDLRFSVDMRLLQGQPNRDTFGHMPSGEFSISGVRPEMVEAFTIGSLVDIEISLSESD